MIVTIDVCTRPNDGNFTMIRIATFSISRGGRRGYAHTWVIPKTPRVYLWLLLLIELQRFLRYVCPPMQGAIRYR